MNLWIYPFKRKNKTFKGMKHQPQASLSFMDGPKTMDERGTLGSSIVCHLFHFFFNVSIFLFRKYLEQI